MKIIDAGLGSRDAQKPERYLAKARQPLDLARASRSDGTLQFYSVRLPTHWDASKHYPLYIYLHGRESDLPLSVSCCDVRASKQQ